MILLDSKGWQFNSIYSQLTLRLLKGLDVKNCSKVTENFSRTQKRSKVLWTASTRRSGPNLLEPPLRPEPPPLVARTATTAANRPLRPSVTHLLLVVVDPQCSSGPTPITRRRFLTSVVVVQRGLPTLIALPQSHDATSSPQKSLIFRFFFFQNARFSYFH